MRETIRPLTRRTRALCRALLCLLVGAALVALAPVGAQAATGTALSQATNMYPRAISLRHSGGSNGDIIADATSFPATGPAGAIYESTDGGASFQQIGQVADPLATTGLCCTTLFEVPRRLGDLTPGTLLWAGTIGQAATDPRMSIDVWESTDTGRTWTYLSTAYQSPNNLGIWEPEFSVDAAGQLVIDFSDETEQPAYSQFLTETASSDGGRTWSAPTPVVQSTNPNYRPGMATVQQLPNGRYVMTYEVCGVGGQYDCAVHLRTSADGWSWGDPSDMGTIPTSTTGQYFAHTPTVVWSPGGGPQGSLLLIGQLLLNADGSTSSGNGDTYFINTSNGNGPWQAATAPVSVPDASNAVCPNYSPTLVPLDGGSRVLEVTTDTDAAGDCLAYYASSTVPYARHRSAEHAS